MYSEDKKSSGTHQGFPTLGVGTLGRQNQWGMLTKCQNQTVAPEIPLAIPQGRDNNEVTCPERLSLFLTY